MALNYKKCTEILNEMVSDYQSVVIEQMRENWWWEARYGFGGFKRPRLKYFRPWYDLDQQSRQWRAVGAAMPFGWIDDAITAVRSWRKRQPLRTRLVEVWTVLVHGIPYCEEDHY